MSETTGTAWATTLLFVPGSRPERFCKALESGADLVVHDLEDSVPAGDKSGARDDVVAWLRSGGRGAVRVNAPGTDHHDLDVSALHGVEGLESVVVPMAEDPAALCQVADRLPGVPVLALVETAKGVRAAAEIASVDGVSRLGIGHLDLAVDLGCDPESPLIEHARHEVLLAARAVGSGPPVDGVTPDVRDLEVVAREASRAALSGFGGKLCIHPAQLAPVAEAFRPSAESLAWAERITAAVDDGVGVVEGQMIDAPVLTRARAILARAGVRRG